MALFDTNKINKTLFWGTLATLFSIHMALRMGMVLYLFESPIYKVILVLVFFMPYVLVVYWSYLYLWAMIIFRWQELILLQKFLIIPYLLILSILISPTLNMELNYLFRYYYDTQFSKYHAQSISIPRLLEKNIQYNIGRFILDYQQAYDDFILAKTKEAIYEAELKKHIAYDCIYRGINQSENNMTYFDVSRKARDITGAIIVAAHYTFERYKGFDKNSIVPYQASQLEKPKKIIEQLTNWDYPERPSICDEGLSLDQMYQKIIKEGDDISSTLISTRLSN